MIRRKWAAADDAVLVARYPHESAHAIAVDIGRTDRAVYARAKQLGLMKSVEWMAENARQQWAQGIHNGSRATQFQAGAAPHNKGRPAREWNPNFDACTATQFRKGEINGRAAMLVQPIGATRVTKDGQLQRKTNNEYPLQRRWVPVSRLVWEAANGPVPAGHVVRFLDGKATVVEQEITLDRLELVSRSENMRRNSRHTNYPPELNKLIQLTGALNRKINNRAKRHEEPNAGRA